MPTLADRAMRVALTGIVPDDDPSIIADMQAEIERLTERCAAYKGQVECGAIEIERLRVAITAWRRADAANRVDPSVDVDALYREAYRLRVIAMPIANEQKTP
jgi:hypothetical protein